MPYDFDSIEYPFLNKTGCEVHAACGHDGSLQLTMWTEISDINDREDMSNYSRIKMSKKSAEILANFLSDVYL